jgi:hypothetical protein
MVHEVYLLIASLVIVGFFSLRRIRIGIRELRKYWGKMVVACPENQQTAAVEVSAARAALGATIGAEHVELCSCTRWPKKEDCGQQCLGQIEQDPESHRLWTIASQWYAGKNCAYCKKPIGRMKHFEHQAALLNPDQTMVEWEEVPAEKLPDLLKTAEPVCWGCHVTETFRREHPTWVVERPWKH